jgi:hypothetical protein
VIVVYHWMSNFSTRSLLDQVRFWRDNDDVLFVLDQHA